MAQQLNEKSKCGLDIHLQPPNTEPVFHFTQEDGYHGVAGLESITAWALDIFNSRVTVSECFRELYVVLPGGRSLLPCALTFAGSGQALKLVVTGTAAVSGVLWTYDL